MRKLPRHDSSKGCFCRVDFKFCRELCLYVWWFFYVWFFFSQSAECSSDLEPLLKLKAVEAAAADDTHQRSLLAKLLLRQVAMGSGNGQGFWPQLFKNKYNCDESWITSNNQFFFFTGLPLDPKIFALSAQLAVGLGWATYAKLRESIPLPLASANAVRREYFDKLSAELFGMLCHNIYTLLFLSSKFLMSLFFGKKKTPCCVRFTALPWAWRSGLVFQLNSLLIWWVLYPSLQVWCLWCFCLYLHFWNISLKLSFLLKQTVWTRRRCCNRSAVAVKCTACRKSSMHRMRHSPAKALAQKL